MYKRITEQAELSLVTVDEVKRQCRVFHNMEDVYLGSLIIPYSDLAQSYTNRMLTAGTAEVFVEEYEPVILLPYGEVTEVTEVSVDDVETTNFTFNPITQKVTINDTFTTAKITFSAGYTTVPDVVKMAVLMMISTAYNNRDDIIVGQTIQSIPMSSRVLLDRVRLP